MQPDTPLRPLIRFALASALALLLGLLYMGAVLDHGYIYDDRLLIERNIRLTDPLGPLRYWADPLWKFPSSMGGEAGFWRPLTLLTLGIARWVSDTAAWGPHLFSLVLHWFAALAAVSLSRRLGLRSTYAWALGFLFALHPVQVQAVAWASAINDPLAGLFALLALGSHMAWLQSGQRRQQILSVVFLGLGLLTKEQVAAVVPIAWLMTWFVQGVRWRPALLRCLPLASMLLVYLGLRMFVFGSWTAGLGGAPVEFALSTWRGITFRFELLGGFAQLLLWPFGLDFFRGVRPEIPPGHWSAYRHMALAVLVLAGLVWSLRRGWRMAAFWIALPLLWLGPQVVFYQSAGAFPMADRYLYLPVFAFLGGLLHALQRLEKPAALLVSSGLLLVCYGVLTHTELPEYSDDETFYRTAIEQSPEVPIGHWSLSNELLFQFHRDQDVAKLDEAMLGFWSVLVMGRDFGDKAAKLGPGDPVKARLHELEELIHGDIKKPPLGPYITIATEDLFKANMGQGWAFLAMGNLPPKFDKSPAIEVFEAITGTFSARHEAWIGLGKAYDSAGRMDDAHKAMAQAIKALPTSPDAWFNQGEILRRQGKYLEAAGAYKEAHRLRPYSNQDHISQIMSLFEAGQLDVGEYELKELSTTHGSDPEVIYLHGMLGALRGQWENALNSFDRVLAKEPLNSEAHLQRGKVLSQMGRTTDAVEALGKVCELDSDNFEAHSLIGQILVANESTLSQARDYLQRAYQLGKPGNPRLLVQNYLSTWIKDDEDALWQYMLLDEGRGDFEACLRWIELLVQVPKPWEGQPDRDARMAAVQLSAGNGLKALGQTDRAIEVWNDGIAVYEPSFWLHYELGSLLQDLNRETEALPALLRAQELVEQVPTKEGLQRAVGMRLESQIKRAKERGPEFLGPR